MRLTRAALVSTWIVACGAPAFAASLEVLIRERGGGPIADQKVYLMQEGSGFASPARRGRTDRTGKVTFDDVPPGSYTLDLDWIADSRFVLPRDNPWAPLPKRVIRSADERASMVLELWRGVPVDARWLSEPKSSSEATIVFTAEGGGSVRVVDKSDFRFEKLLPPGRWVVSLEFPEGYVLEALEVDRVSVPGAVALLDLSEDSPVRDVTWKLAAPCLVTGRVEVVGEPSGPWVVTASLIEPGARQEAAQLRGSPIPDRVQAHEIDETHYEIHLPAGRWHFAADAEGLEASDPPFADVSLEPGDTRTLDFRLTFGEDDASKLVVIVLDPQMLPVRGAHVELRPIEEAGTPGPAIATAISQRVAVFPKPPKGNYLVVAGHDKFVEGSERVSVGEKRPPAVTVVLRAGAVLRIRVTNAHGDPVDGVRFEATREGKLDTLLTDAEFIARKTHATAKSDLTGLAEIVGLYPGKYRVEGFVDEASEAFGTVTFGKLEEAKREASVELADGGTDTLDARIQPAAGLSGSLRCSDGPVPTPYAALRVFEVESAHDAWDEPDLRKGAVLAVDRVPLKGKGLDRFAVGPIAPGAYKVAIRPAGVEAWTWVGGTFAVRDALTIHLEPKTGVDLGAIVSECGPIVVLEPALASKEDSPELESRQVEFTATRAEPVRAQLEIVASRALALGLPEGRIQVKARIEHPYLVPSSVELSTTLDGLARGKLTRVPVGFKQLGGRLEVHAAGAAIRARGSDGSARIATIVDGIAEIPGLPPGKYDVELCADPTCEHAKAAWSGVEIGPARTTYRP